ncbi:MAG: hypothetical protein HY928_09000 [Elusimicrobia bacterium]|nr:hypothetical protein [Elusimicrobiota bacterium]
MKARCLPLFALGLLCACRAHMEPLPDPFRLRSNEETLRAPVGALSELERLMPRYKEAGQDWMALQHRAFLLSLAGDYAGAVRDFDNGRVGATAAAGGFEGFEAQDAAAAILREAEGRRVVMVNEAHHMPRHRAFTRTLLEGLYERGYRYLAAETFSAGVSELALNSGPTMAFGYYSAEPVFGDMVREALRLGYRLVPYEDEGSGCVDPPGDPQHCANQRDRIQAEQLNARVFGKDPQAKVLVHAGFDHIYKGQHPHSKGWKTMARVFTEVSGLDPLCVDQVQMSPRSGEAADDADYKAVLAAFAPGSPIVLRALPDRYWVTPELRGLVDMQVVHPRPSDEFGRPDWLRSGRSVVAAPVDLCAGAFPCLLQAFHQGDDPAAAVAADQVLARAADAAPAFALRPGTYLFVAVGADAKERGRRAGLVR